jgi:hypothetical protein
MTVDIRQTPPGGKLDAFLDVVDYIYRDDPNYVRPLDMEMRQRLSSKNPFFEHAEAALFTAHRNGFCVGRVSAQIDRSHLERYRDDTGFFGFLDTIDDPEVARALLDTAGKWLTERGMKHMRGPLSLNINEEIGCLIDGFDTPPMVMMPHHRAYQASLIEKSGFAKIKDVFAWRYVVGELPPRAQRAHDDVSRMPEVKTRHVDKAHLDRDVRLVMDIFNDAWSDNWGFVPLSEGELNKLAEDFKLILEPKLTFIAEIEGEPAAFAVALPNLNELIHDMGGALFPLGLPKLLWRLKVKGASTARLALLGIRKKFRGHKKYAGLSTFLYAKLNRSGHELGIRWGELSWTLEDNAPVNVGIKFMGGKVYKTYRLFERAL